MNNLPQNAKLVEIDGATVPFFTYSSNEQSFLQFDSSQSGHPEPMINAMVGLEALASFDSDTKLIMINSKPPLGLFPKIEKDFDYEIFQLEDENAKIIFTQKNKNTPSTDFSSTNCGGGNCANK